MPTSPKGVSPLGEIRSPLEDYVLGLSPSTVTPSSTPSNPRHCGGAELHAASSSACCRLPAFLALYEICDISQAPTSSSASLPDSTAAQRAAWSRSVWLANASAKSPIALSKRSLLPR